MKYVSWYATINPAAVVISAEEIPVAKDSVAGEEEIVSPKTWIMPVTVPSSPSRDKSKQ